MAGPFGELRASPFDRLRARFALYYTAQGKRETLVGESAGKANVIWRRIAISGLPRDCLRKGVSSESGGIIRTDRPA